MDAAIPYAILGEERCRLGEGAAFDPATGTAWWFDILGRRLFEAPEGGAVTTHPLPVMASALGTVDGRHQVIAAEDGLYLRRPDTGDMTRFLPVPDPPGVPSRSNDGRVHPSGTFWISTMGRAAEPGAGAIRALHRGALVELYTGLTVPNAICFSADGATGFFADSATNILHRVPLDPRTGLPADEPRPFLRAEGTGVLDGAVVDAEGLIWCARWGGARVDCYGPDRELLRRVPMPARQPSCPVFAGPGRDRLLVTSAFEGLTAAEREADPHGGRTFIVRVGAVGGPEPRVRLD